jgi:subtilisin family serine protease
VRFFFNNNKKVTAIYLWRGGGRMAFRTGEMGEYVDVRGEYLRNIDFSEKLDLVSTLTFNGRTVWPDEKRLPEGFDPEAWIDAGMNPGLGVRRLNEEGINGKGVSIGVIDYGLNTEHPEFAGRIAWYCDLMAVPHFRQEGAAIAGLLAGVNCGVARDADLYYCAIRTNPSEGDYVEALARLIEKNRTLSAESKIRVVCVAASPGDGARKSKAGQARWDDACVAAEEAGMLIIDGTQRHGIIRQCSYDPAARDDISGCITGGPDETPVSSPNNLYAPTSPRTVPEHVGTDGYDYAYYSRGEPSWSIAYCVGVLALGWQLNGELTGDEMIELLYETAYVGGDGAKIIYPLMFVTEAAKRAR